MPHRTRLPALVLATTLALAILGTVPSGSAHADTPGAASYDDQSTGATTPGATRPRALSRAAAVLAGTPAGRRVDATLALRDVFLARPTLDERSSVEASRLLARPTDGTADPYGDGYSTRSVKTCSKHVCVHWVRTTADAPPSTAWAKKTLKVMNEVWRHHVVELGYRAPATDGGRGGDRRFDVYLKELGSNGLYGYCAPERRVPGQRLQASGFCVLDNDFAKAQFGRAPIESLRVTAAHEFFHAIQFAYDFHEDPWLLESTATWMEERFADRVDDNRTYLRYGQVGRPATSLDLFDASGLGHYGNWAFWEYLSERYGRRIVRDVIERAGTGNGLPDDYSVQALRRVLQEHGGFARTFGAYVAANTDPRGSYDEGRAWPVAAADVSKKLSKQARSTTYGARVNHLASKSLKVKPDSSLSGRSWRLRVKVAGPGSVSAPVVMLVGKRTDGSRFQRRVKLDRSGAGRTSVTFSSRTVSAVTVVLANASTRYRCDRSTSYACQGRPLDQRAGFTVEATAYRG